MKYLIVGLGNPGNEYENTRHNIGFKILDELNSSSNLPFKEDRFGLVSNIKYKGRNLILLKPNTFMNLSGKAVIYWLQKEKIPLEKLLVVTDDLALPFGTIRIRAKGSDGGHNGLKSIQECVESSKFSRLRFGVGNDFSKGRQVDYVLSNWSEDERIKLPERIKLASEACCGFSFLGVMRAMSEFNRK